MANDEKDTCLTPLSLPSCAPEKVPGSLEREELLMVGCRPINLYMRALISDISTITLFMFHTMENGIHAIDIQTLQLHI
eukprot:scaffold9783_cov52-Cyclotella_meneghiniana.AAC.3